MAAMPRPEPAALIDTSSERSVSFAPPDRPVAGAHAVPAGLRAPHAVGPGRAAIATPTLARKTTDDGVSGYPIQLGKVRRPPLHDETLARHRLLDWLDAKVHSRVIFVIADAGYGKTTLLADFSRGTRHRTLWYRMDAEDRNWVSFLSYLVASGRVHDRNFAPRTSALLENTGPGGVTREEALQAFVEELPAIAPDGAILVLDDFHVADDVEDIRSITKALVALAPERFTIVFSARRVPSVPVARLRALGEVSELTTIDLRFSDEETGALFLKTYGRSLEPDVLEDLSARTEGWAASLYLVQAALRDRSAPDTRAFIRRLSGAQSELYDYLAEEVIGDLPERHRQFLMRTAILQSVDMDEAALVTKLSGTEVAELIGETERLGLLARRHERRRPDHTYHPLVQQFLEARLRRDSEEGLVSSLHRAVAVVAESRDWRSACFHYAAAGDRADLHRVLEASIENIVGAGEVALAHEYLLRFPPARETAAFEIIRSRMAASTGDVAAAVAAGRRAVELDPQSDASLGNLLQTFYVAGDLSEANDLAARLASSAESATLRQVGAATRHVLGVSLQGNLDEALASVAKLRDESKERGLAHYEGVSLLNMALMHRAQGSATEAFNAAAEALHAFATGTSNTEIVAALLAQAWAMAHLGKIEEARSILATAGARSIGESKRELLAERAEIEVTYGNEGLARSLVDEADAAALNPSLAAVMALTRVQLALREEHVAQAISYLPTVRPSVPTMETGYLGRYFSLRAHCAVVGRAPDARDKATEALAFAERQGAALWAGYCKVLLATLGDNVDAALRRIAAEDGPVYFSMVAELILGSLNRMDSASRDLIAFEAQARPERWRPSVRRAVGETVGPNRLHAAHLLDAIGEEHDVPLLRGVAKASRNSRDHSALGKGLARRLAPTVFVEDLGRVEIRVGSVVIAGTDLRRKVLAMLCYLLTRAKFSATRDEVVDALWPDMAPEVAANSLNQTVYFLRRVFEPTYKDDHSAGYVHHDSDVLWLDQQLIRSRSQDCRNLIDALGPNPSPAHVDRLSEAYLGRFALDFTYDEWSVPFRDALHVAYLRVIEEAVSRDIESGHFERGITLARRALDLDPDLENLELSLLRLYRVTGAHSAAAEQYAHYAAYLREELGIEPPPLASL
jgi:LuxR family maltose regulon positive regulatory protein